MIKVLFWNIKNAYNKKRIDFLNESTNGLDVIVLAEAPSAFINGRIKDFTLINGVNPGSNYIKVFVRKNVVGFSIKYKTTIFRDRVTVLELLVDNKKPILLFCVHLKSKVGNDSKTQLLTNILGSTEIHNLHEANNKSSIIVGDFNHNPYDTVMLSVDGFNCIPNKMLINHLKHRPLHYKKKDLFFNPMWKFFSENKFNGTFFFKENKHSNSDDTHWNILDQVIISKDIMNGLNTNNLDVISDYINSTTGRTIYLAHENFYPIHKTYINPEFSDHLPITFSLIKNKLK